MDEVAQSQASMLAIPGVQQRHERDWVCNRDFSNARAGVPIACARVRGFATRDFYCYVARAAKWTRGRRMVDALFSMLTRTRAQRIDCDSKDRACKRKRRPQASKPDASRAQPDESVSS